MGNPEITSLSSRNKWICPTGELVIYMSRAKDRYRTHHDTGTSGIPWIWVSMASGKSTFDPRVRKREDHERPPRIKDFPAKNKTTNTISIFGWFWGIYFDKTPMLSCCVALCPWSFDVWSKPLYEIARGMALHKTFYAWFFCWLDPQFYSQTMVLHDSAQSMGSGGEGVRDPYFIEDMLFFQFCFL